MIFELLRAVLGLALALLVPGYIMSRLIFAKLTLIERLSLSLGLSMVLIVFLGFFLSTLSYLFGMKMITALNVWASLIIVSLFFALMLFWRARQK